VRRRRWIGSRAGAVALAVVLAAACAEPAPRPSASSPPTAYPEATSDSARLRPLVQQAVEARVARNPYWKQARLQVGEQMWMRIIPSEAVPGLSYAWGFFVPPNTADVGPFAGVVGALNGTARILEATEDWASLVGPAWAPRGPGDALTACVEATAFIDDWPSRDHLYTDTASALFAGTWPFDVEEMKRRLTNPAAERTGDGGWVVGYWMVMGGRSVRYRCMLHPGAPAAAALQIVPVDTADVGSIRM
jgi:hypothetical protein